MQWLTMTAAAVLLCVALMIFGALMSIALELAEIKRELRRRRREEA